MKIIMKFGGTSLQDGERIRHVAQLIQNSAITGATPIIVVSAMANITDSLVAIIGKAISGDQNAISNFIKALRIHHEDASKKAIIQKHILKSVLSDLKKLLDELARVLMSISYLKESTPRSRDYILSFGEKLSATILIASLRDRGLTAKYYTGGDAGIVTDNKFGNAKPLTNLTTLLVQERVQPCLNQGEIPVITGFIACTQNGITTTLGRGGSDYTATILGASLDVDEIWIWTDVDGLMTADPKIEPDAKTIHRLSYAEAMEMAYFGAKAMYPQALDPAIDKDIPIRIKNSYSPTERGTLIVGDEKIRAETVAKAIAIIENVALVTVSGAGMLGTPGVAAEVFSILGKKHINVLMISQGSSEANISFIIPRPELHQAVNTLELQLLGRGIVKKVMSESDVCIIAVVGAGMKGTPGVAAQVFKAIADEEINVRMIAQGSSELNISFLIQEKYGIRAIRKLHREFQLATQKGDL
jgi:aspartate kinase